MAIKEHNRSHQGHAVSRWNMKCHVTYSRAVPQWARTYFRIQKHSSRVAGVKWTPAELKLMQFNTTAALSEFSSSSSSSVTLLSNEPISHSHRSFTPRVCLVQDSERLLDFLCNQNLWEFNRPRTCRTPPINKQKVHANSNAQITRTVQYYQQYSKVYYSYSKHMKLKCMQISCYHTIFLNSLCQYIATHTHTRTPLTVKTSPVHVMLIINSILNIYLFIHWFIHF